MSASLLPDHYYQNRIELSEFKQKFTPKLNQLLDVFAEMTAQFKEGIRIDMEEYDSIQKQICEERNNASL